MPSRLGIRSKPDDNESVADSLAFLLDCYGHHAAVAHDGETVLWLLRTGAFEITLLNEHLPDIKRSAVARSRREVPIRFVAFVVSMTGDAVSRGDIAGLFDVYLPKSFSCEVLTQVIEDARCSSDANTRQAACTNCCRRKRTQPIV